VTTVKSYRLGTADERDVRWGLSQDIKGDVGMKSGFYAFLNAMNLRSKLEPWEEKDPPRTLDGYGVDLSNHEGQAMECKAGNDHRTLLTYEMSEELLGAASEIRRVWGAFAEIELEQLAVLARRYRDEQVGGLEAFGDLGALVFDTKGAIRCHKRECGLRNDDPGIVGALQALSKRIHKEETIEDEYKALVDGQLFRSIYAEADARLSDACRAYVAASSRQRQSHRVEQVAKVSRRNGRG
jgi:hypothetical protein